MRETGRGWAVIGLLAVMSMTTVCFAAEDEAVDLRERRDQAFARLDVDHNKRLTREEYVQRSGDKPVLERDFKLFDFSGDGSLSRSEFAATPGIGPASSRGGIPDPFAGLLHQAVDAMDEAYDGWDQNPTEQMNSTFFAINFSASLATDNRRRLDREIVAQADADGDHMVTRDEAKRFLEIQLGIRWTTGTRLRMENGRVVNFTRFLRADTNTDNIISKAEFVPTWWRPQTAEADFAKIDLNGDGELTLDEFADERGPNLVDPIGSFRSADTNLDAMLDAEELAKAIPDYRANLISSTLSGFGKDGKISLNDYRLSMLGNVNYSWASIPKDENNDDLLSFEEFVFSNKRNLFQLQRRLYFHRFDRDGDKRLSSVEFEFRAKPRHSLILFSLETGETKEIYKRKEFPTCGSPMVSADGKTVAFDVMPVQGISKTRILKMDLDGMNVHNLCEGLMPTWSPDGERFACSRYEGGSGIWIMKADGTAVKRISDGWAAAWSPDGKSIAFTSDNSLRVYDVESEKIRVVLEKEAHPYQYIFWNMSWSPDSKRLVFKGRLTNKQEIAIVNVTGKPNLKRGHSSDKQIAGDLAWSPDGKRILFNMYSNQFKKSLMHQFAPDSDDPPQLVPKLSTDRAWASVCFTPDGKWLILSSPN